MSDELAPMACRCCAAPVSVSERLTVADEWAHKLDGYCYVCALRQCETQPGQHQQGPVSKRAWMAHMEARRTGPGVPDDLEHLREHVLSPGLDVRRQQALTDSAQMGDPRTAAARRAIIDLGPYVPEVWGDLFDCAIERHRINAGLVTENRALRDRLNAPTVIDLSQVGDRELLAELTKRLEVFP